MANPRIESTRIAQVITITTDNALDPIDVIMIDHAPGQGRLIVRCYAQAWTAWWGAMGDNDVRSFVCTATADYVAGRLLYGPGDLQRSRARKLQESYVERIVRAIQDALRAEGTSHV